MAPNAILPRTPAKAVSKDFEAVNAEGELLVC